MPIMTKQELQKIMQMCSDLATELDAGNTSNLSTVGEELGRTFVEHEWKLYCKIVSKFIHIDRIVKYELDLRPEWSSWLKKINMAVSLELPDYYKDVVPFRENVKLEDLPEYQAIMQEDK